MSRRSRAACSSAAGLFALWLLLGALPCSGADENVCAPLPPAQPASPSESFAGAGIVAGKHKLPRSSDSTGRIVELPGSGAEMGADDMEGEALLILPKRADGSIPMDFVLAEGASVASSAWSPVLCATLVRVVGPIGLSPAELVPSVPKGALVVPNHRYHASAGPSRPALLAPAQAVGPDPYLPLQYGLALTGVLAGRPQFAGAGVRVALLDSAPDTTHRELLRVRVLPLEDGPPSEPATHGTLLAGVIAAIENNAFGIAGIAPAAELLAIPVCAPVSDPLGEECRMFDVLRGIDRAWAESVRLVNLALVGPPDPVLERAMDRLRQLGILVVAAAGNEGTDHPRYPAGYSSVIGVGALDEHGRRWARSNYGASVSLLAPGVEVLSTLPGDRFAFADGTSLAAAHVTGLLAVLLAASDQPELVRRAMLDAAHRAALSAASRRGAAAAGAGQDAAVLPRLCDVLPALGQSCPAKP
ncbi:MAG TPA: S8 family serine peptidase [Myxococcota bacterium]|nr:S8 family serine peptidase [Myxococcota bacterium]